MREEFNVNQIIRKDARGCFVESLNDSFTIGKIHLAFSSYDTSRPAGKRQTNNVHIYISADEFLELCRKLNCGELQYMLKSKKASKDKEPMFQQLGGTSADKLKKIGRERADGKGLSRTMKLLCGDRSDFLLVAESGPGEESATGLITPKFGKNPENHVAVSMSFEAFSELLLLTQAHFNAWLGAWYARGMSERPAKKASEPKQPQGIEQLPPSDHEEQWF